MEKLENLFILKKRDNIKEWSDNYTGAHTSGLFNSVSFMVKMLNEMGRSSEMVEVVDNNYIDAMVYAKKPKNVFIEALWVVPEKFEILRKLHPKVNWIIRLHSEVSFLACEGISIEWIKKYIDTPNVYVGANSDRVVTALMGLFPRTKILYLPNYYPISSNVVRKKIVTSQKIIDISCFGAIRPLKNQLIQAMAAIIFADQVGKKMRFHINSTRKELQGDPVLKNIRALFDQHPRHELVEHEWMPHEMFKDLIREKIDIGLQCSYTETYNIVAADHIDCGVPIVGSNEIRFIYNNFSANFNEITDIVEKLHIAYVSKMHTKLNLALLRAYNNSTKDTWETELNFLKKKIRRIIC